MSNIEYKHIKTITEGQIKRSIYLSSCFKAMKEIHNSPQTICNYKKVNIEVDGDEAQIYERNYIITLTIELVRLSCHQNSPIPDGIINGEVLKKLSLSCSSVQKKYVKIRKALNSNYKGNKKEKYVLPDFLIHESHSIEERKMDDKHQHLAMEAKTKEIRRKELFFLDFLKLNYYLDTLNFADVVYLIVGTPIKTIDEYIGKYLKEVKYISAKASKHLYLFIQDKLESEPVIYKLK